MNAAEQDSSRLRRDAPGLEDGRSSATSHRLDVHEVGTQALADGQSPGSTIPPKAKRTKLETAVLMTSLCLAVFFAALDVTIVTIALPKTSNHFHSTEGYKWVGSSFLLAAAVVAPSWGKFSDIWGRKPALLTAIAVFFIGSVLCGAAVGLPMLLCGRAQVLWHITPLLAGLKAIDWLGSVNLIGGILMFLMGLEFGGTLHPWKRPAASFAAFMSVAIIDAGVYVKRTGRYLDCIRFGAALLVLGSALQYNLPYSRYWPKVILYQLSNVSAQDNGAATASSALVRNIASAIGVVVGSVIFANRMDAQQHTIVDALGAAMAEQFSGTNAQANLVHISGLDSAQRDVVRKAFWASIRDIWVITACLAVGALLASIIIKRNELERFHVEVKTGLAGEEKRRRVMLENG
ncbi:hypothetical protein VP1G_08127 [Cytospora mali]|uniref:Major facilitator superfamily (MFS) profile domain-containing protein n=1 Tax=Cytospora mali TaxID=578113 RepID=A0A194VAP6_CYTMA|nr:hypothetical protein VP1G_08127 [Valsa mali var. pyri (nom. inval.)]